MYSTLSELKLAPPGLTWTVLAGLGAFSLAGALAPAGAMLATSASSRATARRQRRICGVLLCKAPAGTGLFGGDSTMGCALPAGGVRQTPGKGHANGSLDNALVAIAAIAAIGGRVRKG